MAAHVKARPRQIDFSHVLVIGAWGFAMVIASMLFLYVGYLIDEMLNTPPTFMLGLSSWVCCSALAGSTRTPGTGSRRARFAAESPRPDRPNRP